MTRLSTSFRHGVRDTLPLVPPIAVFGAVYAALAVRAGLSPALAVLSSIVILSGSAQVAMVGLLAAGPGPVLLATTGLALRHLPMSATLSELIGEVPLHRRLHLAYVLVDESFGLTVNAARRGEDDLVAFKTAADMTLAGTWLASTGAGAWMGGYVEPASLGLDVVFPLVFLALAIPLLRDRRMWFTAAVTVATTVGAVALLPPAWRVTAAALMGAVVGSRLR